MTTELVATTDAKRLIAKAVIDHDAESLDELRRQADAYQLYQRRSGAQDVANDAGEIKVRAERGLGAIDKAENPHGKNRFSRDSGGETLELGVAPATRANWRKLSEIDDDELERRFTNARNDEEYGISTARILSQTTTHVSQNTGENEWYTPPEIISAAREVMGDIDLDPASSAAANKTVGAVDFYTKENSGLGVPWMGRVWLNPPYVADLVSQFTAKLCAEYMKDNVEEACLLVNNATETAWFQTTAKVANAVCFHSGRISYWHPDRTSKTPLQGQAILYFGPNTDRFARVFQRLGVVFD